MSVEDQIMIIYAVTNKHLMDVPVDAVKRFEKGFLEYMRDHRPEIGAAIRSTKELKDDIVAGLEEAIKNFKAGFSFEDLDQAI